MSEPHLQEVALLEHQIDLAVHSLKDIPTKLPEVGHNILCMICVDGFIAGIDCGVHL